MIVALILLPWYKAELMIGGINVTNQPIRNLESLPCQPDHSQGKKNKRATGFDKSGSRFPKSVFRFLQNPRDEPGATFEKKWLPVPNLLFVPLIIAQLSRVCSLARIGSLISRLFTKFLPKLIER